jgi:hypothetical protein
VVARDPQADARSDRRTLIVGISAMLGLIVFGLAFGARFGATECRRLEPQPVTAGSADDGTGVLVGDAAATAVREALGEVALAALLDEHGPLELARELPIGGLRRIAADPAGVLLTGAGTLLLDGDAALLAGARFGEGVEVVGDGSSVYAVVVGNVITGQVDALRPLQLSRQGVTTSACVDTSAVGSPLSFLHDAREGLLVGLRTDEDGSESVLELRDASRGRVWAPPVLLGQVPAGLQGARTTGRIAGDVVVLSRRLSAEDSVTTAVLAVDRTSGDPRWTLEGADLRAALQAALPAASGALDGAMLAAAPTLRVEVVDSITDPVTGRSLLRLLVTPDVAADALLPPPLHGPFAGLVSDTDRAAREAAVDAAAAATVHLDLRDGSVQAVTVGREASNLDTLLRTSDGGWLLVRAADGRDLLLRFGG